MTSEYAKTFYLGTKLMTPEKARAVWAIYVWCRRTDELVDGPNASCITPEARRRFPPCCKPRKGYRTLSWPLPALQAGLPGIIILNCRWVSSGLWAGASGLCCSRARTPAA